MFVEVACTRPPVNDSLGIVAPRITGWLHTDGTRIVDPDGHAVRLLGIDVRWLGLGNSDGTEGPNPNGCGGWRLPDLPTYDNVVKWGFNSVRLSIAWSNLEPTPPAHASDGTIVHTYNLAYIHAVDTAVKAFTDRGIAVVIEMSQGKWSPAFESTYGCVAHGFPAWLYEGTGIRDIAHAKLAFFHDVGGVQEQYVDAWRYVARRYVDNRLVVGADMLNEPYVRPGVFGPRDIDLLGVYQKVGAAIRGVNPHLLLIFQDTQDLFNGQFSLPSPPAFDDVVYEFHDYAPSWDDHGRQKLLDYERRADAWNVPLWIGEFNAFRYGSDEAASDWAEDTARLMRYCKEHDIGWDFFAYQGTSMLFQRGSTTSLKPGLLPALQRGF